MGREFVNKQNEKALNDLSDAADLLMNGPDNAMQDALDKAFNPKDPDCKTNKGVIPGFQDLPQNKQKSILTATEGVFKRLEKAFLDDTVEANFFEFTDPPGILLSILADRGNRNINFHLLIKNVCTVLIKNVPIKKIQKSCQIFRDNFFPFFIRI